MFGFLLVWADIHGGIRRLSALSHPSLCQRPHGWHLSALSVASQILEHKNKTHRGIVLAKLNSNEQNQSREKSAPAGFFCLAGAGNQFIDSTSMPKRLLGERAPQARKKSAPCPLFKPPSDCSGRISPHFPTGFREKNPASGGIFSISGKHFLTW